MAHEATASDELSSHARPPDDATPDHPPPWKMLYSRQTRTSCRGWKGTPLVQETSRRRLTRPFLAVGSAPAGLRMHGQPGILDPAEFLARKRRSIRSISFTSEDVCFCTQVSDRECADHDEGGKGGWWLSSLELEEFGVEHPGDRLRQRHHRQHTRDRTLEYKSRRLRK